MCAAYMHACARVHTCLCMSVGAGLRESRERLLGLGVRPAASGELAGRGRGHRGGLGALRLQAAFSLSAHTPGARTHFHGLR